MAVYQRSLTQIEVIPTPFLPAPVPDDEGTSLTAVHRRMALILALVSFVVVPLLIKILPRGVLAPVPVAQPAGATVANAATTNMQEGIDPVAIPVPLGPSGGGIAPVFTAEVMYWEPQIIAWSQEHGVDPNLAAIIMQIESCGDPHAASYAGAQGLFQVMPFHFAAGEDALDPDTNARRGLNYFVERLAQTNGDIGRAFAGYNGGHVAAANSWDQWAAETQRYYRWSTGIYSDIQSGLTHSPTVESWLQAGGASLCRQAAQRIGLSS